MEAMISFVDEYRDDARGRADLHGAADRPVDLPRRMRAAGAKPETAPARVRRDAELMRRDPAGVRRELPGLRRAQGLAAAAAGGLRRRPLHGGALDEENGLCKG